MRPPLLTELTIDGGLCDFVQPLVSTGFVRPLNFLRYTAFCPFFGFVGWLPLRTLRLQVIVRWGRTVINLALRKERGRGCWRWSRVRLDPASARQLTLRGVTSPLEGGEYGESLHRHFPRARKADHNGVWTTRVSRCVRPHSQPGAQLAMDHNCESDEPVPPHDDLLLDIISKSMRTRVRLEAESQNPAPRGWLGPGVRFNCLEVKGPEGSELPSTQPPTLPSFLLPLEALRFLLANTASPSPVAFVPVFREVGLLYVELDEL